MNIAELIKELSKYNGDLDVVLLDSAKGEVKDIYVFAQYNDGNIMRICIE